MHYAWLIFMGGSILFFIYSIYSLNKESDETETKKGLKKYILLGLFLMIFDFTIETLGGYYGVWTSQNSLLLVGYVPIEVMVICILGGTGWVIQLDTKVKSRNHLIYFVLFWTSGGAIGEQMLLGLNLMTYGQFFAFGKWTLYWALLAYFLTWVFMVVVSNKFLKKESQYFKAF